MANPNARHVSYLITKETVCNLNPIRCRICLNKAEYVLKECIKSTLVDYYNVESTVDFVCSEACFNLWILNNAP